MQEFVHYWKTNWQWLVPVVCVGAFLTLLFVVALMERRLVRPYVSAVRRSTLASEVGQPLPLEYTDEMPDPSQASPYVAMMSRDLAAQGFEFAGFTAHAKAPRILILGAIWWSPSRTILALTGSGTVMKMPAYQTWLFTPLADGRFLVTTDNTDEGDSSGLYVQKRVINGTMEKLLSTHAARMENLQIQSFAEPNGIDALLRIYQSRLDRLLSRGLACYTDSDQTAWHYTFPGAVRVCLGFFSQLATAISQIGRARGQPIASTALMPVGRNLLPVNLLEQQQLKSEQA